MKNEGFKRPHYMVYNPKNEGNVGSHGIYNIHLCADYTDT